MKVLIADDDADSRRLLKTVAEKAGHSVIEASNGAEALALAGTEKPEVIISDVLMPVMDGFYLLMEIKKKPGLRDIPFVFYSATYTEYEDISLAMSLGADAYIIKPKEPDALWAEVGQTLFKRKTMEREGVRSHEEISAVQLREHARLTTLKLEHNVTKLKEALAAARLREEELLRKAGEMEKVFSVAMDLLCVVDLNGRFRFLNPAWQSALGYDMEQLRTSTIFAHVHPDDAAAAREAFASIAAGKELSGFECSYLCADGASRRFKWRAATSGELVFAAAREVPEQHSGS